MLAATPKDLSSIPSTHEMKREKWRPKAFPQSSTFMLQHLHTHTHMHTRSIPALERLRQEDERSRMSIQLRINNSRFQFCLS